jgi:glycerate 2-kinase
MRVLAALDKFRGTATAAEAATAVGHAAWELGLDCDEAAVADGGEGTLDALGGANKRAVVTGPLGRPVEAGWRLSRGVAVIEMAQASGLSLAGGAEGNDPVGATTTGTGELIDKALDAGAHRIVVCLGGSATTDGGLGAVRAIRSPARLRGVDFVVACDVRTEFTDAAVVFGPQKGASHAEVQLLTGRLQRLVQVYADEFGVDVSNVEGAGAAGGLAGGLMALGARIVPGFEMVADELDLHDRIRRADVVVTGEGYVDEQSFEGKVVGNLVALAHELDRPVVVVAGDIDPAVLPLLTERSIPSVSLVQSFGEDRALREPLGCIEAAVTETLRQWRDSGRA